MKFYGKELILDLHQCDATKFNRKDLKKFFKELCKLIDMEKEKLIWWDYLGVPKDEIPNDVIVVKNYWEAVWDYNVS